jgi:hypothetical protein
MKKNRVRWSWYLIMLLLWAVALAFRPTAGRAGDTPGDAASGENHRPSRQQEGMSEMFQGKVGEVLHASRHIYVRVDTGKRRVWVAVPAFEGNPGDEVIVPPGVQVANFHSRKLHRTFKMMIFVGSIRRVGEND